MNPFVGSFYLRLTVVQNIFDIISAKKFIIHTIISMGQEIISIKINTRNVKSQVKITISSIKVSCVL